MDEVGRENGWMGGWELMRGSRWIVKNVYESERMDGRVRTGERERERGGGGGWIDARRWTGLRIGEQMERSTE